MESTSVDSSEIRLTQPDINESRMETVGQLTVKGTRGRAGLRKLRPGQRHKSHGITSQCTKNKPNATSSRDELNLCHDGNEGDVVVGTSQKEQVVDPKNKNKEGGSHLKTKTTKESNPSHSASSSIDKNEDEAKSDGTNVKTTTDNTTGLGKTRSNKLFLTDPVQNEESLPWECRFCGFAPLFMKLGDLFGPYYVNRKRVTIGKKRKTEIWFHQDCALWAPEVILVGESVLGLDSAVLKADKQICQICERSGATIGCFSENCTAYVHFLCGKLNNWKLDYKTFRSHCYQHNEEQ